MIIRIYISLFIASCILFNYYSRHSEISGDETYIHLINVADTNNATLGKGFKRNASIIKNLFSEISEVEGYCFNHELITGENVTYSNVKSQIHDFECGSNDVVIFYYSGHGGNDKYCNIWPSMLIESKGHLTLNIFEDVHKRLLAKKPKLLITIGDCCNFIMTSFEDAECDDLADTNDFTTHNELYSIFDFEGDILVSSSSRGEYAISEKFIGGYYTNVFASELRQAMSSDMKMSWERILSNASKSTLYNLDKMGESTYHPQSIINLK